MIVVIPSAGRAGAVTTHKLFRKYFICVPKSQAREYSKYHEGVIAHPDAVHGMGEKRQWILDNFKEKIIFMADDDNACLQYMGDVSDPRTGYVYKKITDPDYIWEVLLNTAGIARDLGTNLFGFNELPDKRKFDYIFPFSTRKRINGFAMGIIKDGQRFDPRLVVKQDYDFFLMSLYWKRFVWRDDRYCFLAKHYTNAGGLCGHRSISKEIECIQILQKKFGPHVVGIVKDKPWKVVLKKL